MKERRYRKAIFVVVYCNKNGKIEYLILQRKHHWKGWEFPKGGINPHEKMRAAVRREVREETGLNALKINKFSYHGRYLYKKKFADRTGIKGQTFSLYAAEVEKGNVKIDRKEHSGFSWMTFGEAIKKIRFNNQKKSLRLVNAWLKNRK